jgi:DNA-binding CsgD family transcriptional regulator
MFIESLTPAEDRVARLLINPAISSNEEIARRLNIGMNTLATHVGRIYAKLQVPPRQRHALLCRYMSLLSPKEREEIQSQLFVLPEGWVAPPKTFSDN